MYYKDGGFYPAETVPDAVEVSQEDYIALIEGQSRGKQIVTGVDGQPILAEPQPSRYHEWNGKAWVISADKEVELKTAQQSQIWEQIKAKREVNGRKGCFVASVGKWFHTDDHSRQQYIFMRTLAKIPPKTLWKTMDNSFVEMTKALLDELSFAMFTQEQSDFANAERHRLQMLAANAPLEYDFSTGWSETYEQ